MPAYVTQGTCCLSSVPASQQARQQKVTQVPTRPRHATAQASHLQTDKTTQGAAKWRRHLAQLHQPLPALASREQSGRATQMTDNLARHSPHRPAWHAKCTASDAQMRPASQRDQHHPNFTGHAQSSHSACRQKIVHQSPALPGVVAQHAARPAAHMLRSPEQMQAVVQQCFYLWSM